jgi:hypothetical protein
MKVVDKLIGKEKTIYWASISIILHTISISVYDRSIELSEYLFYFGMVFLVLGIISFVMEEKQ